MAYGTVKVDTIIFDQGGADQNVTVSGIYRAITSGVTVSGTISGAVLIGTTTVSGATVTGTQSSFTSGNFVTLSGVTATFTSGIIASGTAAAPSLSIVSDPNTGLYSPGADQAALATAGAERLRIDSSGQLTIAAKANGLTNGIIFNIPYTGGQANGVSQVLQVDSTGGVNAIARINMSSIDLASNNGGFISFATSPGGGGPAIGDLTQERMRIVQNGNVGIGTSSPTENLTIYGAAARLAVTGPASGSAILLGNQDSGGVNNPAVIFAANGELYFGGGSSWSGGGTIDYSMFISDTGNVGIGTISPSCRLHLSGTNATTSTVQITTTATSDATVRTTTSLGTFAFGTGIGSGTKCWNIYDIDNAAERLRIDSSGRVGIGTSSPNAALDVVGNIELGSKGASNTTAYLDITTDTTYTDYGFRIIRGGAANGNTQLISRGTGALELNCVDGGYLGFSTSNAERVRIDSSGRVGIGTSAPTAKLHVETIPAAANQSGSVLFGPDTSYGFEIRNVIDGSGFPRVELRAPTAGNGPILFFAGGSTERMRIDSNGDVAIGTATSLARLTLEKAFAGGTAIDTNTTTASTTYSAAAFRHNGTVSGSIAVSTTATSYLTSSDYRLKENVTAVTDGITRLQQLKPSRFNFIADPDHTVDGFIAHEVQDIVPEAITGEKDAEDDDGNFVYQGIDQSKLVPLLTAALQEAIGKIETLEARLTAAGID